MIKIVKSGDGIAYICDCGNGEQQKFTRTILGKVTVDERGRKHSGKEFAISCDMCESILTRQSMIDQSTKKFDLPEENKLD